MRMQEKGVCAHMAPSSCAAGEEAGGASAHVEISRQAAPDRRGADSSHLGSNPLIRGVSSRPHRSQRHTVLAAVAAGTILAMTLAMTVLVVREGTGEPADFGGDEHIFDASSTSDGWNFGAMDGVAQGGSRRLTMLSQPLIVAGIGDGLFALVVLYIALFVTVAPPPSQFAIAAFVVSQLLSGHRLSHLNLGPSRVRTRSAEKKRA